MPRSPNSLAPSEESLSGYARALALLLVAMGVVLRFAWPDLVSFGGEQIETVSLAYRSWLCGGAERGLRVSVGVDMPPFAIWLLSLPVALTLDPVRLTQFVMLVNLAGLALLYRFARTRIGAVEAWLITILCASLPWALVFARKIWAQDFVLPFWIVCLVLLFSQRAAPRLLKVLAFALALSLFLQIYPSTWFLVPPLALGIWFARVPWRARDVVLGLFVAAVPWIGYVRYQFEVGFDDIWSAYHALSGVSQQQGGFGRGVFAHALGAVELSTGRGLAWLPGIETYEEWQAGSAVARSATYVASAFWGVAFLSTAWSVARLPKLVWARARGRALAERDTVLGFLTLLFVGLVFEYSVLGLPAIPHYHVALWPCVPIFTVLGVRTAWSWLAPRAAHAALFTIGVAALAHGVQWVGLQNFFSSKSRIAGAHGPLYAHERAELDLALRIALQDVESGPQRRAEWSDLLGRVFAASSTVLLEYDGTCDETAVTPTPGLWIEATPAGLFVENRRPPGRLELPPCVDRDGIAILKLDVSVPIDTLLVVFFAPRGEQFRRAQFYEFRLLRGRHTVYLPLDDRGLRGRLAINCVSNSLTLRSAQMRLVTP